MTKTSPNYRDRIVRDPAIMAGKPTIKGTRIPVDLVLGHLVNDPRMEHLAEAYPRLTLEDVQAVLAYALDAVGAQHRQAWVEAEEPEWLRA